MSVEELKKHLHDLGEEIAKTAEEYSHEASEEAQDYLADAVSVLASGLKMIREKLGKKEDKKSSLTPNSLEEMAAVASEFDKSGDEMLIRQANVMDEILRTIGSNMSVLAANNAHDDEIEKIKAKQKLVDPYTVAKTELDKQNRVEESKKALKDKVKEYRPLEAPLMTRTCPDHPGAQMTRVTDSVFQCSMDKGIYNYQSGFTTLKGNVIPGGELANQTQAFHDRPNEVTSFDTRESKLNS